MELANLLENACGNSCELQSYITLLKNMGYKEKMNEEVGKLLLLDKKTLTKVRELSRPFYENDVSEFCFN